MKPLPQPIQTRTRMHGYGFAAVGVQVALGNPRVTHDNHYLQQLHSPIFQMTWWINVVILVTLNYCKCFN